MADIADQAQQQEAYQLQDSLARVAASRPQGPSLECCEDCGCEIPEKRRQAVPGCTRCIACQEEAER
jgi:phage/conjugal plasmid C-4 type zinc finger TraR family protein